MNKALKRKLDSLDRQIKKYGSLVSNGRSKDDLKDFLFTIKQQFKELQDSDSFNPDELAGQHSNPIAMLAGAIIAQEGSQNQNHSKDLDLSSVIEEIQIPTLTLSDKTTKYKLKVDNNGDVQEQDDYVSIPEYETNTVKMYGLMSGNKEEIIKKINSLIEDKVSLVTSELKEEVDFLSSKLDDELNRERSEGEIKMGLDAKTLYDILNGKNITLEQNGQSYNFNVADSFQKIQAQDHYTNLANDLFNRLKESNGIVKTIKQTEQVVQNPDGTTQTILKNQNVDTLSQNPTAFSKNLFQTKLNKNGNDITLYNVWRERFMQKLTSKLGDFVKKNGLSLNPENDKNFTQQFLTSLSEVNNQMQESVHSAISDEGRWQPVISNLLPKQDSVNIANTIYGAYNIQPNNPPVDGLAINQSGQQLEQNQPSQNNKMLTGGNDFYTGLKPKDDNHQEGNTSNPQPPQTTDPYQNMANVFQNAFGK